jgi:formylglycine-generating enzyme required for sulfatase activity
VPASAAYHFHSHGKEIEGPPGYGVDFQMPWEDHPQREHSHTLPIPALSVDEYLVTNAQWLSYVNSSGYEPADPLNYLRFWTSPTSYPAGSDTVPVTWISYDEAKSFCAYYGRRLPLPWEWQYFASNGHLFPWGDSNGPPPSGAVPNASAAQSMPLPPDTTCCAAGRSEFGVQNVFGHVWQWTSVFSDEHTRAAFIVGGSFYRPAGSGWYLRHPENLREHNKLLTMDDSYDRSGAIGFRCVAVV